MRLKALQVPESLREGNGDKFVVCDDGLGVAAGPDLHVLPTDLLPSRCTQ